MFGGGKKKPQKKVRPDVGARRVTTARNTHGDKETASRIRITSMHGKVMSVIPYAR